MAGDYLFNQNQRRPNQSPWTPYQQPNQPPPNPDYPELFASRTLLPDRRYSRWRRDRQVRSRNPEPVVVVPDLEEQFASRSLIPVAAPGARRAANRAYVLAATQVELYGGAPQEVGDLFPALAPGARRAAHDAYRLAPTQVELYGGAPQEVGRLLPTQAPGARRTVPDAYQIPHFFDPTAVAGDQFELFNERQLLPDRYRSPWRRYNRRATPSPSWTPPAVADLEELFPSRSLLPDRAPGPRRVRPQLYEVGRPPAEVVVVPQQEELFQTRELLPKRYTSRWRRDRTRKAVSSQDAPPPPQLEETYPGRVQFSQPPIWSRRVSILLTNDDGLFTIGPLVDNEELLAVGRVQFSEPPVWSRRYHVLLVNNAGNETESNVELIISKSLLPDVAPGARRAPWDSYQIAPSLVELYGGHTPLEVGQRLMPDRAPGRPRAARRAYELENNNPSLYAPAFVPPTTVPRRTLLGVGL